MGCHPVSMDRRASATVADHPVAFAWGFAEATAFFVVPDVWLSLVALRDPRRALAACGTATAGAVLGGLVTRHWSTRVTAEQSADLLTHIPAIGSAMLLQVDDEVARLGYRAMLNGPRRGVPYKLYARSAGLHGLPAKGLVVWTVPARIGRFLLVAGGTAALARSVRRRGWLAAGTPLARLVGSERRAEYAVTVAAWMAFYGWYFSVFGGRKDDRS